LGSPAKPRGRASQEARYVTKLLTAIAVMAFGFVILLTAIFVVYMLQGVNSVMIYNPPIGGIMSFELNLAQLGAEVLAGLFGIGVLLHQLPRIRDRLDRMVEGAGT